MPSVSNAYRGCRTPSGHRAISAAPFSKLQDTTDAIFSAGPGRRFTPPEDQSLLDLRRAGLGWKTIGKRIGRPPNSCLTRHRKLMEEA